MLVYHWFLVFGLISPSEFAKEVPTQELQATNRRNTEHLYREEEDKNKIINNLERVKRQADTSRTIDAVTKHNAFIELMTMMPFVPRRIKSSRKKHNVRLKWPNAQLKSSNLRLRESTLRSHHNKPLWFNRTLETLATTYNIDKRITIATNKDLFEDGNINDMDTYGTDPQALLESLKQRIYRKYKRDNDKNEADIKTSELIAKRNKYNISPNKRNPVRKLLESTFEKNNNILNTNKTVDKRQQTESNSDKNILAVGSDAFAVPEGDKYENEMKGYTMYTSEDTLKTNTINKYPNDVVIENVLAKQDIGLGKNKTNTDRSDAMKYLSFDGRKYKNLNRHRLSHNFKHKDVFHDNDRLDFPNISQNNRSIDMYDINSFIKYIQDKHDVLVKEFKADLETNQNISTGNTNVYHSNKDRLNEDNKEEEHIKTNIKQDILPKTDILKHFNQDELKIDKRSELKEDYDRNEYIGDVTESSVMKHGEDDSKKKYFNNIMEKAQRKLTNYYENEENQNDDAKFFDKTSTNFAHVSTSNAQEQDNENLNFRRARRDSRESPSLKYDGDESKNMYINDMMKKAQRRFNDYYINKNFKENQHAGFTMFDKGTTALTDIPPKPPEVENDLDFRRAQYDMEIEKNWDNIDYSKIISELSGKVTATGIAEMTSGAPTTAKSMPSVDKSEAKKIPTIMPLGPTTRLTQKTVSSTTIAFTYSPQTLFPSHLNAADAEDPLNLANVDEFSPFHPNNVLRYGRIPVYAHISRRRGNLPLIPPVKGHENLEIDSIEALNTKIRSRFNLGRSNYTKTTKNVNNFMNKIDSFRRMMPQGEEYTDPISPGRRRINPSRVGLEGSSSEDLSNDPILRDIDEAIEYKIK